MLQQYDCLFAIQVIKKDPLAYPMIYQAGLVYIMFILNKRISYNLSSPQEHLSLLLVVVEYQR
jgi:hypothetical protein